MIYIQFLTGLLVYSGIAYVSYGMKESSLFYPLGLTLALIANAVWLWISQTENDANSLMVKGMYWDAMLTLTYIIVPLLLFNAKLTGTQLLGFVLLMVGLIIIKI